MNPLAEQARRRRQPRPLPGQATQILTQISAGVHGTADRVRARLHGTPRDRPVRACAAGTVADAAALRRVEPRADGARLGARSRSSSGTGSRCTRSRTTSSSASPWVQQYFRIQLNTLIDSLDFDPNRMQSAFEGLEMLDPERMAESLQDPDRLIQAAWTPLSNDAMARLQAFMTLAEGYATFVMDAVGAKLLSDHARLKEAMERRPAVGVARRRAARAAPRPRAQAPPVRGRREVLPLRRRDARRRVAEPRLGEPGDAPDDGGDSRTRIFGSHGSSTRGTRTFPARTTDRGAWPSHHRSST